MQTEWDFSSISEGNSEKVEKKVDEFQKKWSNRTDYLENPTILKQALDEYEEIESKYPPSTNELYLSWLKRSKNQNDPEIKAEFNKNMEFTKKMSNKLLFFMINITKIPKEKQKIFLESKKLEKYRHLLEKSFEIAKHVLSDKEEKILNLKSSVSSAWSEMTSDFLSREEREVLTESGKREKKNFSELFNLINSQKKQVRDDAAKAINDILEKYSDVAEHEINALLKDKQIEDELRGYERPDQARHVSDDISTEVVDTLIETVSKQFQLSRKFYELKSKLLGLKQLEYHERNVPYGSMDKEYSLQETTEMVDEVFSNLDNEFYDIFNEFKKGYIDFYPKKGKTFGAFCVSFSKNQPIYILLNFNGKIHDIMTLAHECGHGINDVLMKKQHALYYNSPLSTAEVSSTFMEDFVLHRMIKDADDQLKLELLMYKLNEDISTIMRQVACYRFEKELHKEFRKKGYLSKKEIGELFEKHMKDYMGDFVEQSPGSENWWVYWSHIRRFFYVYSYASGLLISKSLQDSVKKDPKFIENVKYFLSAGSSESPKNIFKNIGIDITKPDFWNNGLKNIENDLKEAETLAKKLGNI